MDLPAEKNAPLASMGREWKGARIMLLRLAGRSRVLLSPLFVSALSLLSLGVGLGACGAERVTIDDDPDSGLSRTPRDAATGTDSSAPTDSSVPPDAGSDAARDARDDGPITARDAEADASTTPTRLVISEVFAADILSKRYVEIAGPPAGLIGDLRLRIVSNTGVVLKTVDVGKSPTELMPARGTWVVGGIAEFRVDNGYLVSDWDLPSDNGTVQLVRGSTLLDVVGYGAPAAVVQSAPTEATEGAAAITPGTKSLLRRPPHLDTGSNAADFCRGAASPNAPNVCDP